MNKNTLIQKNFQKIHLLKIENPQYQKTLDALFNWLLASDHAENDITAKFLDNKSVRASIRTRQDIIAAGIEEVEHLVKKYPEITFQKKVNDGEQLKKGGEIAVISGRSGTILSLERTILNVLQRMSGIAAQTRKFTKIPSAKNLSNPAAGASLQLAPKHFPKNRTPFIAATRKTPWMLLDKKAVAIGGGLTHRLDLSDGILIKDNHLQIIKNENNLKDEEETVIHALKTILPQITNESIEIEVNTKEAAFAAIKIFSQIGNKNSLTIMLDNWNPKDAQNFMKEINTNPDTSSIIFEASGNINESNLKDWAATGIDIISSGALTHSAKAADLSLTIS